MDAAARDQQLVATDDGRQLCFAEWGDPGGQPVVLLHGTPGCRYNRPPDEDVLVRAGARLITCDRPGYGRSERLAGRAVVDCVDDVRTIVDSLGIDRFSVTGSSGGGPHVLAVAARLGDRVDRARCNVGLAPYDADRLDFFAGMDPRNIEEFGWALEGESRLVAELTRELDAMVERVAADGSKMIGDDWDLDDSDRAVLADPRVAQMNRVVTEEIARGGVWGWVDDSL